MNKQPEKPILHGEKVWIGRWTRCIRSLPEDQVRVLASQPNGWEVTFGYLFAGFWYYSHHHVRMDPPPCAWMAIPEPYTPAWDQSPAPGQP